jgi:hypothetical protein
MSTYGKPPLYVSNLRTKEFRRKKGKCTFGGKFFKNIIAEFYSTKFLGHK